MDEEDRVSVRGEGVPGVQAGVHRGRRLLEEVKKRRICARLQENVERRNKSPCTAPFALPSSRRGDHSYITSAKYIGFFDPLVLVLQADMQVDPSGQVEPPVDIAPPSCLG